MNHDDFREDAASASDNDETSFSLDRRQVIAGLAAGTVAAASAARGEDAAPVRPLDVRIIRNPSRHDEFGVGFEFTAPIQDNKEEKIAVALYPRTFGDIRPLRQRSVPVGHRKGPNGALAKDVQNLERIQFPIVVFSDGASYSLELVLDRREAKPRISGAFARNGAKDKPSTSVLVDLAEFLRGRKGLTFDLDFSRAEQFRWDVFGERLEVEGKKGAKLSLYLVPDPSSSTAAWTEVDLRLTLEPNDGAKMWALNGTVSVKKLSIRQVDGDQGDGARIQEDQEIEALPKIEGGRGGRGGNYRARAWIGEAVGGPTPEASDLKWELRTGAQQGFVKRYKIGKIEPPRAKPALEITQSAQPTRLTLRQWGKARNTLVVLRAPFDITIRSAGNDVHAPAPPRFPLAEAILTRQDKQNRAPTRPGDIKDEVIEETLIGRLEEKAFAIDTVYGSFIVEGDPPPKPAEISGTKAGDAKAAADDSKPPLNPLGRRLDRRDDFATRPAKGLTQFHLQAISDEIVFFDARALLRQIAVPLPNTRKSAEYIGEEAAVWSRLDFTGTEIAFRLPLALPPDKRTWPSARGIVTLAQEPCDLEPLTSPPGDSGKDGVCKGAAQVSIALDGARLQARRDSDNLALTFQFARMALELGKNGGRIVPNARLSGGGAGDAPSPIEGEARRFDDRSLLIVNFPPQHVAEKVYYRQVNDGVTLPDVPGGITGDISFARDLKEWRDLPLSDPKKITKRKDLFDRQTTVIGTLKPGDPLHDRLRQSGLLELIDLLDPSGGPDKWQDKVGDGARARLVARWNELPLDQRTYYLGISAGAMDPDVRKVWSDIWRAYRTAGDFLPDVPSSLLGDKDFAAKISEWTKLKNDQVARRALRKSIFDAEQARLNSILGTPDHPLRQPIIDSGLRELLALLDPSGGSANWFGKVDPVEAIELKRQWDRLPADQRIYYLGTSPDAMDEDVRRAWREIWRAYRKASPGVPATAHANAIGFAAALGALPDPEISQDVQNDLKFRLTAGASTGSDAKAFDARFRQLLTLEKAKRSDDFGAMQKAYRKRFGDKTIPRGLPDFYSGRDAIRKAMDDAKNGADRVAILNFVRSLAIEAAAFQSDEFLGITSARLSGPSRLVFRFDSAGGAVDDLDITKRSSFSEDREPVRSIHFSLDGLTDWGRFDLAVIRRAETLEMRPGGRVPHPGMRGFDLDPARILANQFIRPGRSIEGRMSDIRDSLRAPEQDDTAIELPFRLQLSPDQFGRFKTRRRIARKVLRAKSGTDEPASLNIMPALWSANLQVGDVTPTVRAIWSDDFCPGAIVSGADAPPKGPDAPWQVPPKIGERATQFRTALDAYDRHEIVALTSVYGLPVMGRRNEFDSLVDGSQYEPPQGYKLDNLKLYDSKGAKADLSAIYNPATLNISELRLTALGGSLRHDSSFTPPAGAVRADNGANLFEAFSVERWRQITVLGRDIEVEVVYKGFLFPLGVRAALVKLTERRFIRNDKNGVVTAFLIQRKFIRIGNPRKSFPAVGQADRGRRFPVSDLTMLTRETPDIVDPDIMENPTLTDIGDSRIVSRYPNGQVAFEKEGKRLPGRCFWPRSRAGEGGNIWFEFKIEGDATPLRMPLLFIDNRAVNNPEVVAGLADYYNWENVSEPELRKTNTKLRQVAMGGAKRRYADENKDGECQFETYRWDIKAEGRQSLVRTAGEPINNYYSFDPLLQGSDQPPFYPYVATANIRLGQAERFVGHPLDPADVKFPDEYARDGFLSAAEANPPEDKRKEYYKRYLECYLELTRLLDLDMGEGGDRSGGIGRPAMKVRYLSRRYGLMSSELPTPVDTDSQVNQALASPADPDKDGTPPEPPAPPFNLKSFFDGEKLFGTLRFTDLLNAAGSAVPELKENVDAATEDTAEFLRQSVLPEIERALKALEDMWETARKVLTSQAGGTRGVVTLEINKIYPDIAPALSDLIAKVERAKKASNVELIGAMSAVQASGRKFVTAINRTLADPVAPLREELRAKFRFISEQVQSFGDGLGAAVNEAIRKLADDFRNALKDQVERELRGHIAEIAPFTRLMLAFPFPDTLPVLTDDDVKQVAAQFDAALAEGAVAFVSAILTGDAIRATKPEEIEKATQAALQAGLIAAEAKIDPTITGLRTEASRFILAYKNEAKALLDDLKNAADDVKNEAKARLLRQVTGIIHPLLFDKNGIVRQLAAEADALVQEVSAGGRDVLEIAARHIANALRNVARLLIEQQAKQLCVSLAPKVAAVANRMLPPVDATSMRPRSLKTLQDAIDALAGSASADKLTVRGAAVLGRYGKIRASLTDNLVADACSGDDPKAALSATVAKIVQEVTALKQAVNTAAADVVRECEKELAVKVQAAADIATGRRTGDAVPTRSQRLNAFYNAAVTPDDVDKLVIAAADQLSEFIGADLDAVLATLDGAIPAKPPADSAVNRAVAEQLEQLHLVVADARATLKATAAMIQHVADPAQTFAKDPLFRLKLLMVVLEGTASKEQDDAAVRIKEARDYLKARFAAQLTIVEDGARASVQKAEDRLMALLGDALAAQESAKRAAIATIARVAQPVFKTLNKEIYGRVQTLRNEGREAIKSVSGGASAFETIMRALLRTLRGPNGQQLEDIFTVPPVEGEKDQLDRDIALLERLADPNPQFDSYVSDLATLAEAWKRRDASPILLLRNISYVLSAVLKGDLAQFVDLQQIRRQVDEAIRSMVPSRISRSYDLKIKLKDLDDLVTFSAAKNVPGGPQLPRPHPQGIPDTLVLRAKGVVDLLQPDKSTFSAEGYLPGFGLTLLPAFDVATLYFPPASFTAGLGKPFHIALKVDDVQLGEKVQFLKNIQSIMSAPANGNGFFIRMMSGRGGLGIVVGYALPISPIMIGNMFIDNLSLNAAAELPFDNGDARFVISISRPEAPFMIAAAPYAGAGHLGLIANSTGIIGFEASFQFGGGGGFTFGPLTGRGRISVGIFIRQISGLTELYGLFYAGGSARIACFGVGAQLNVRLTQTGGGDAEGEAIFTYSFSIGIKDIEFSVPVYKRENGSGKSKSRSADATQAKTIDLASHEFREVFARAGRQFDLAQLVNATSCKGENFSEYRKYFTKGDALAPGRDPSAEITPKPVAAKPGTKGAKPSAVKPRIWVMP